VTDVPPGSFERQGEGPDTASFGPGRLVTHIDDAAIAPGGSLFAERWSRQTRVVDLVR
jgi:hypothetical protein